MATRKPTPEEIFSGKFKPDAEVPASVRVTDDPDRPLTAEEQFAKLEREASKKTNKQVRRAPEVKDAPPADPATDPAEPETSPEGEATETKTEPSTDPATDPAPTE